MTMIVCSECGKHLRCTSNEAVVLMRGGTLWACDRYDCDCNRPILTGFARRPVDPDRVANETSRAAEAGTYYEEKE